ncbi:MAG: 4-(cytidine 5'-diphospho)-2-C-methyl-D-erythritol kinase [Sphingobacteriaceae bacterium]|nr:4-(cytidine 5'-diphospho)-2-C-methyl-D-erythritol kinase [Sphingobacteriaceae bacterium]
MILFPNSKINLGLSVTEKRKDGFHNIETVFYPVNWLDVLEITLLTKSNHLEINTSGISIKGNVEQNLIYKAWELVKKDVNLPGMRVDLFKNIPMGAGLGGGSSDAAFFLKALNTKCELNLNESQLLTYANQLGSDCAFFLKNNALFAHGKGNEFEGININLSAYCILIVYPNIHSNTAEAYGGLSLKDLPTQNVKEIVEQIPVEQWKNTLYNHFEVSILMKYPKLTEIKQYLYSKNALYVSLSGSGSAIYAIFKNAPELLEWPHGFHYFLQKPNSNAL